MGMTAGAVAAAVAGTLVLLKGPAWWPSLVAPVVLLAHQAWAAARRDPSRRTSAPGPGELADTLAAVVRRQWAEEAARMELLGPRLPVPWAVAGTPVSDHWIGASPADLSSTLRTQGHAEDLVRLFARLPSRRLVVLGPSGSGKTVLAMRLVLDLLEQRQPGDPVPVLLPISTWDPSAQSYPQWLAEQLTASYGPFAAPLASRTTTADALVRTGHILPVLDGLDELPPRHRAGALAALNTSLTAGDALVLTCRSAEYAELVSRSGRVLARAAVVELKPLRPADVYAYLSAHATPERRHVIARVLGRGATGPLSQPLAQVLTSPLSVQLFRTRYDDPRRDPLELLDPSRFPDTASITDRLLQSFVADAVSRSRSREPGRARVERWLSFLAAGLSDSGRQEISWWELEKSAPSWVAAGAGALLVSAGTAAAVLPRYGTLPGLIAAAVSAVAAAGLGLLLTRRAPGVRAVSFPTRNPGAVTRALLVALVACAPLGLATARMTGWQAGTGAALAVFVPAGVTAWLTQHSPDTLPSGPRVTVHASHLLALSSWLALALSLAVTWYLAARRLGTDALTVALVAAVTTVPWLTSATAWGRFTAARTWLALRGLLPWRFLRFLEEMLRMGLIRPSGASHQFRHARLLDTLAHRYGRTGPVRGAGGR